MMILGKGICQIVVLDCGTRKMTRIILPLILAFLTGLRAEESASASSQEGMNAGQIHNTVQFMKLGEHGTPVENTLTELDYSIGGGDFYTHFMRRREPILFRGIASNWAATKNWHNESYLKEKYGGVLMDVELGKIYKNELYPRKTMNMTEFLALYRNKSLYLDSPFPHTEMMRDLEVPYFMQCPELSSNFTSAHLLFSSGNTSSCFHQDSYENLLTMISGIKVVTLVNYTYIKEVYADHIDTFPGLSPISPEGVDFNKWPLFKDVPFYKVISKKNFIIKELSYNTACLSNISDGSPEKWKVNSI